MNLVDIEKAVQEGVKSGAFECPEEAVACATEYLKSIASQGKDHAYLAWKKAELEAAIQEADEGQLVSHDEICTLVDSYKR